MDTWSFHDSGPGHPFRNMALDEVLLLRGEGDHPLLRFYSWEPPALSLGYFQRFAEMSGHPVVARCGAVITRRITGGDAILHIHELTYSLVGFEGRPPFDGSVESSYHRIHLALAEGFRRLGVASRLRDVSEALSGPDRDSAGRCFYRVTRYDLVAGGAKLVGSAQRRTRGRVLHHGSIPLARNPMTPGASDLESLAGRPVTYPEVSAAVRSGFEKAFGIRLVEDPPGSAVLEDAERLARVKYSSADWIGRR